MIYYIEEAEALFSGDVDRIKMLPRYRDQYGVLNAAGNVMLANSTAWNSVAARNEGMLLVAVPDIGESGRAELIADAGRTREESAKRTEMIAQTSCPKCGASPGDPCVGHVERNGYHPERLAAADRSVPKPPASSLKAAASKPAAAPTISSKPASPKIPRRGEGIANKDAFPFFQRRLREARVRHALGNGDYLAVAHESTKAPSTTKLRPASAARFTARLGNEAHDKISKLTQAANGETETGGVLIGYQFDSDVYITDVTGPGPDAVATKTSVLTRVTQDQIDEVIASAQGNAKVLGSWHSHPHGFGEPSAVDQRALVDDHEVHDIANPIMLIMRPDLADGWARAVPVCWSLAKSSYPEFDYDVLTADVHLTRPR
jgi:integrative and conjugative element protein (TIGR02256 family)